MVQMKLVGARTHESSCVLVEIDGLDRRQEIDVGRHSDACWHGAPGCPNNVRAVRRRCLDRNQHGVWPAGPMSV